MKRPGKLLIASTFVLLCLIWGTTWAAIQIGLQGIAPFTGVALRFAIAAAVLLAFVRALRIRLGTSRRERGLWLVNGGLAFSVSYAVVYWAEQWVPSGLAAVLFATYPLFVALLVDALSDPLVGYVSDRWRSRWGRRHPFMYTSGGSSRGRSSSS